MRNFTIVLFVFNSFLAQAKSPLQEKYPHGLLTDDYGVLTEADLVYAAKGVERTPYKIEDGSSAYQRWQCFETKKMLFRYSTWRDDYTDFGRGATLCDYSFQVNDEQGVRHLYVARRAKELVDCRELFKEWKKVRKDSKYTCILGEPGSYENKEKGWIWGKTKTKSKCMSYFVGECDSEKKLKEYENEK
ncbi:MAG: hypothetical protein A2381_09815 [Bdellovibrionales bacterium RIFOXYB1_FULL_37_110]|nr:MAG: hypothetical protein A2181_02895 [Bdellovibrionales bacterium RIFOXYA1_FULL_38_20]OFZ48888.1 MAG: hypothetical protein A2417_08275 [Bdellovibrionales bacterium RIFOXYC1_FULL_37_79]OFZ59565.1 MAG: hypothetical protein A2381_09815 [Bdellovibrionales bacterium RIFOXYB1_FULL_37_110]OFZ62456.1 MAG: hypothetical protein A2577_03440 [Bdellovibrionales bacterium RIFOXYD1_FULL_36_51]